MISSLDLVIINGVFLALALALFTSRYQKSPKLGVVLGLLIISDVLTCVLPEVQVGASSIFAFIGFVFALSLYLITGNILSFLALIEVFAPQLPLASVALLFSTIPPEKLFKARFGRKFGSSMPQTKTQIPAGQQVSAVLLSPLRDSDDY